jgi:hypothetical protein
VAAAVAAGAADRAQADDRLDTHLQEPMMTIHPLRFHLSRAALAPTAALLVALSPGLTAAADPAAPAAAAARASSSRVYFASPEGAVDALVAALRKDDVAAVRRVLGPGYDQIVDSGDSAADREERRKFVAAFDAKHSIRLESETVARMITGPDDWPSPVPIVKRATGWTFDAPAGADEILARRIGQNELDVIQVCLAFVDMQREYAELDRDGDGILEYSSRLVSSPGRKDGLYWETAPGEPPSPAGPKLVRATPDQLAARTPATPFHGYLYRVLKSQGKHAPGGARNYELGGNLIGGIALVAWPAKYRVSGVKTFKCSVGGGVYERDLGPDTAAKVAKIKVFDPGPGWNSVK